MKSRMPSIYFTTIYTACVFLTINSLGFGLAGAIGFDSNSTSGNSSSAAITNTQTTNLDQVTVVPPSHTTGQATVVVGVNVNQDDKSKNVPQDLVVTAIGINGGSAVIPVSKASGPVIIKVNPGSYMIGEKQELTNNTKFGAEFNGDCQRIEDETFKSTNAAYGTVLNGQTKSCTVTIKFVEP
jgi:hypothetical protein